MTGTVNRNTMSPVNEYGIVRRPRRGWRVSIQWANRNKGWVAHILLGVCPKKDGASREHLPIFGTEADSEVLQ